VLNNVSTEKTFTSDEDVEVMALEKIKAQFSWTNEDTLMFMHADTFEEIGVPLDCVETPTFLVEGENYMVQQCEGKYVGVVFPNVADYTVTHLDRTGSTM
jgi:translation elongation factor P/translation initiation factor 5A